MHSIHRAAGRMTQKSTTPAAPRPRIACIRHANRNNLSGIDEPGVERWSGDDHAGSKLINDGVASRLGPSTTPHKKGGQYSRELPPRRGKRRQLTPMSMESYRRADPDFSAREPIRDGAAMRFS
jgi:hypothetical protein